MSAGGTDPGNIAAGSLRFELGRGGGDSTFSLDFERLSTIGFAVPDPGD